MASSKHYIFFIFYLKKILNLKDKHSENKKEAEEKFKLIEQAYTSLINEKSKKFEEIDKLKEGEENKENKDRKDNTVNKRNKEIEIKEIKENNENKENKENKNEETDLKKLHNKQLTLILKDILFSNRLNFQIYGKFFDDSKNLNIFDEESENEEKEEKILFNKKSKKLKKKINVFKNLIETKDLTINNSSCLSSSKFLEKIADNKKIENCLPFLNSKLKKMRSQIDETYDENCLDIYKKIHK